jgi:O-antigen/teichoic acid export membrane protein
MAFQILRDAATAISVVLWALADPTVWALSGGSLVGMMVTVLVSHALFPSRANRLGWDKAAATELLDFGRWIILSSCLGFLAANGGRLMLGLFVSTTELGYFAIAVALVEAAKSAFQKLQSLWYPAISEIMRERPDRLSRVYYRIRKYQDPLIFGSAGFLITGGQAIVTILYDPRYTEAGWMLETLGLSLIFRAYAVKADVALAMGYPKVLVQASVPTALSVIGGLPIAYFAWGAWGAIFWLSCSPAVGVPALFRFFSRRGILKPASELKFVPFVVFGLIVGYLLERSV